MHSLDTRGRRHPVTVRGGLAWLLAAPMALALWTLSTEFALAGDTGNEVAVDSTAVNGADADASNAEAAAAPNTTATQASSTGSVQGGAGLAEVVVTATRREEALSQVPESVSALTEGSIDTLGIKDFDSVARFVPGVAIDSSTNTIAIRGISASGGDATTGVYIDDTPIQMRDLGFDPDQVLPKTFDLQRVEVLRGPQGTLFGSGSEGGTVRYILTQPSDTVESTYARSEISYTEGGANNYELGIAHGGPIIDGELGFRFSAWFRQDGGWIDNYNPYYGTVDDPNTNRQGTLLLRAALLWQPDSNLTITPSVMFQNRKLHDRATYWSVYSDPANNQYGSGNITPQIQPDYYYLPMVKIQDDMGNVQLISNSSYFNRKDLAGYDGTQYTFSYWQELLTPASPYYPLLNNTGIHVPSAIKGYEQPATITNWQENWTEEVRLQSNNPTSPWTWTAGVYWETDHNFSSEELHPASLAEENYVDEYLFGLDELQLYGAPLLPNGDSYFLHDWGHDEQIAAFGEVSYTLGAFKLIAGGRFSDIWFNYSSITEEAFAPPYFGNTGRESSTPFTPKVSVEYHPDQNNMLYATYSTGFRSGGTNAPIPAVAGCLPSETQLGFVPPPLTYKPDTVDNFEVGDKDSFFQNRVQIANSLYYIKWNGIQQNIYLVSCGLQFTDNVGYAVSKGADIQADFVLVPGLTLQTTAGYNSAYFTQTAPGDVVYKGDAITGYAGALPPWTTSLGLQYTRRVLEHVAFMRFDYQFMAENHRLTPEEDIRSSQFNPYAFPLPARHFASIRAGMHFGSWEVDAFCDNLFDTATITSYGQSGLDTTNFNPRNLADLPPPPLTTYYGYQPRTMGITVIFNR